ncbi:type II toxin-antitoxin system VapC family toxin [Desulfitobacterium hafniense]|uniref:type II toxin-antitoxin system VapC family toxin n=1 Tax=Desulfitobacterium hafniense TaxID=49338 RepID=UPI00035C9811|nr:PIN domain-containing protein [Desulfitobacterium hafniense]
MMYSKVMHMQTMKIYMDVCCLNRPFDDQSQDRIFLETEAILAILSRCRKGEWALATSDVVEYELSRLINIPKLEKVQNLCLIANERIISTEKSKRLAKIYQAQGVKLMDSYHLALCETHDRDVLLTTDDGFIRAAAKIELDTKVVNPVIWLMEVTRNER